MSADTVQKQKRFAAKLDLPYPLLADPEHATCEAYGVWQLKSFMGRKYMGISRTTFVIGADGVIARVFESVKVDGHAQEALKAATEL